MNCSCLLTVGGPTAADGYAFRKYQPSLYHILVINVFSSHDPILSDSKPIFRIPH